MTRVIKLTDGVKVLVSPYLPDYFDVRRTWKERLFTLPWRPWREFKSVYSPQILALDENTILCSERMAKRLKKELVSYD